MSSSTEKSPSDLAANYFTIFGTFLSTAVLFFGWGPGATALLLSIATGAGGLTLALLRGGRARNIERKVTFLTWVVAAAATTGIVASSARSFGPSPPAAEEGDTSEVLNPAATAKKGFLSCTRDEASDQIVFQLLGNPSKVQGVEAGAIGEGTDPTAAGNIVAYVQANDPHALTEVDLTSKAVVRSLVATGNLSSPKMAQDGTIAAIETINGDSSLIAWTPKSSTYETLYNPVEEISDLTISLDGSTVYWIEITGPRRGRLLAAGLGSPTSRIVLEGAVPNAGLSISPDNNWIAVATDANPTRISIVATNSDATSQPITSPGPLGSDHSPAWSPDCRTLAFVRSDSGHSSLYELELESNIATKIDLAGVPLSPSYARSD